MKLNRTDSEYHIEKFMPRLSAAGQVQEVNVRAYDPVAMPEARHLYADDPRVHFDGQVTWDEGMDPSASHGVGTIVMGNCGVGFAPVPPMGRRARRPPPARTSRASRCG